MKFLFDMFPILLFFAAYYVTKNDIFIATGVTIAATAAQVAWMWFKHRKVDTMLWVSFGMVAVLGGATLLLHNKNLHHVETQRHYIGCLH
jgi:intracellular septation protein